MMTTHEFNTSIFTNMRYHYNEKAICPFIWNDIKQEYQERRDELNQHWLVQFDYENVDGETKHFSRTIGVMYEDWWGQCIYVPENDALIRNVKVICNSVYTSWDLKDEELLFVDFIEDLEQYFNLKHLYDCAMQ